MDWSEGQEREGENPGASTESAGPLEPIAFPAFAPLLRTCQAYAERTGCRFRAMDFYGQDPASPQECWENPDAVASVHAFAERLKAGDPTLVRDLEHASRAVTTESVRNVMKASFQELDLWPPCPAPAGIGEGDCRWVDVSAPMPVVAQRLFNDEASRQVAKRGSHAHRRATTACFVVDFAHEVGATLPETPASEEGLLREFRRRVQQYSSGCEVATRTDDPDLVEQAAASVMVAAFPFVKLVSLMVQRRATHYSRQPQPQSGAVPWEWFAVA